MTLTPTPTSTPTPTPAFYYRRLSVQRFRAINDCDGGLAGAGEFEFSVWVLAGPGYTFGDKLLARGDAINSIKLSDGESYSVGVDHNYQIVTGGYLSVTLFATEWDVLYSPDSRMDDEDSTIHIPQAETGPQTIVIGETGCKAQLEISINELNPN